MPLGRRSPDQMSATNPHRVRITHSPKNNKFPQFNIIKGGRRRYHKKR